MGEREKDDDTANIVEKGRYSEIGMGPPVDTSSFDKATPAGQPRRDDLRLAPQSSSRGKRAEQPQRLSRDRLSSQGGTAPEEGGRNNTAMIAVGVVVLVTLAAGAFMVFRPAAIAPIPVVEAVPAPMVEAKPSGLDGINVRKGLQRPADKVEPGKVELNTVPSGGRVEDRATPVPKPADEGAKSPE